MFVGRPTVRLIVNMTVGVGSHLELSSPVCVHPHRCFSDHLIRPRVCLYDDWNNLVASRDLLVQTNISSAAGYQLEGVLAGEVYAVLEGGCATFSNMWINTIAVPFVLQLSLIHI